MASITMNIVSRPPTNNVVGDKFLQQITDKIEDQIDDIIDDRLDNIDYNLKWNEVT